MPHDQRSKLQLVCLVRNFHSVMVMQLARALASVSSLLLLTETATPTLKATQTCNREYHGNTSTKANSNPQPQRVDQGSSIPQSVLECAF